MPTRFDFNFFHIEIFYKKNNRAGIKEYPPQKKAFIRRRHLQYPLPWLKQIIVKLVEIWTKEVPNIKRNWNRQHYNFFSLSWYLNQLYIGIPKF